MSQEYIASNVQKYAIGKQIDIAIADGKEATSASDFYAVMDFSPQNNPEPEMIEDAEGNRSTNSHSVIGDRRYPFSFKGTIEINKIGRFLYYATGKVVSVQDGATGAYTHTFTMLNNVILPSFTIFYDLGAEGYRRLTNCKIMKLTVTVNETEASFTVEGEGTNEDNTPNSTSSVDSIGITDIQYQSGSVADGGSVIRYTLAGSPDLSAVKNGDVFTVPTAATGIANAVNKGSFIVVSANDVAKTVDVINNDRFDNTDDETGLTTSTDSSVTLVVTPSYPDPVSFLRRRHSAVRDASDTSGLAAATDDGLRNFTFEINHNSTPIFEKPKSSDPIDIFAKNITVVSNFTQLMSAESAAKAIEYRNSQAIQRAWRFDLEDTSKLLGTSATLSPRILMTIPQAMGIATRQGAGGNDEMTYDWNLSVSQEQSLEIVLQNEIASYGS